MILFILSSSIFAAILLLTVLSKKRKLGYKRKNRSLLTFFFRCDIKSTIFQWNSEREIEIIPVSQNYFKKFCKSSKMKWPSLEITTKSSDAKEKGILMLITPLKLVVIALQKKIFISHGVSFAMWWWWGEKLVSTRRVWGKILFNGNFSRKFNPEPDRVYS